MLKRRDFLAAAAAAPLAGQANAQPMHPSCLPGYGAIKTRPAGKIEILYKTKHGQPNGLALTDNPGQMWIVDQGAEHWISRIDIKTGDRVLFGKWSGTEVKLDGQELLIMKESDIMGVLTDLPAAKKKAA